VLSQSRLLELKASRVFTMRAITRQAFLGGLSAALLFIAVTLPTYIAIGFLLRHDPIGPGGLSREPNAYLVAAHVVVFCGLRLAAVALGVIRTNRIAPMRAGRLGLAAGSAVFVFLVLIQPLAEFANACYIGTGFLLHPS
jgi:hypothetical protein